MFTSEHLQNTSNIPQNPQKRQKKTKKDITFPTTFTLINNQLFTFTTTFTPHQQLIIHTQMEQKPWAKPRRDTGRSVACSRWWLCLPVCERNRPHTRVARGIWRTLKSSPVCCHSVAPSVNGCCSNPIYKQYIHSMYTQYVFLQFLRVFGFYNLIPDKP